jgi:hypothetical protein
VCLPGTEDTGAMRTLAFHGAKGSSAGAAA